MVKEADPQSASVANAIGADRNLIAPSQAFFATAIEFGSGVGFWVVFGHAGPRHRGEAKPPSQSTKLVPFEPPQKLVPIDERPDDIVERFFLEVVRPALNRLVRSLVMWEAFQQWRTDRNIDISVSRAMFGRLACWQKGRIGGPFGTSIAIFGRAMR